MKSRTLFQWFSRHHKSLPVLMLMTLVLSVLMFFLGKMSFVREIESKTIDFRFRIAPKPERADSSIVLVAIDDSSLKYATGFGQGWPWPRDYYAVVTDYLKQQGAKAVLFDMLFDEPDFDRADLSSEESDGRFAEALSNPGIAVISQILSHDPTALDSTMLRHSLAMAESPHPVSSWAGSQYPIPLFAGSAAGVGAVNLVDDKDSIVRKIPLYYDLQGRIYPSLALCAYLLTLDPSIEPSELLTSIPQIGKAELYLNWYGKGGSAGVFRYLPYSSVLQSAVATVYGNSPTLADGYFKDKYVIIGASAAGLMDLKSSPYSWGIPGMEVWATMLSNLINRDYLRFLPDGYNYLILYLVILLVLVSVSRMKSGYSILSVLVLLILLNVLAFGLFSYSRIVMSLSSPVLGLIVSWLFVLTLSYIMEGKHKRELRMVFNRYLHPDLVNRIVENPDLVHMGGEELDCSVMFSDIYNFTGFSENQSPQQLVSYLNEYFSTFTNSILDHNGLLDKYTGDGLMAVFGAPIARADHARLACLAALAHRDYSLAFRDLPSLTPSQAFHLNTRLGINSGMLVAGNIGSERRMEYTSIGDTVNLSARLEGVNKVFKTHIIISESTYLQVAEEMICRELDYLRVKGKKEPTRIYELLADRSKVNSGEYDWIREYATALQLYREGKWTEAKAIFETIYQSPRNDEASHTMAIRCEYLLQNPPEMWDGIMSLVEK
ncbi:MAG: hypothetical protein CVU48_08455 [Candidatus Cloacimonetes bacterium HGW-Cloacimonetes-1]|jgi:adenylate cyclase|nr:MAG: hypothetical protein CVU48_08455 [Candidatus Cloacimonetes bacterium HGW-Cloacimonetes-1]